MLIRPLEMEWMNPWWFTKQSCQEVLNKLGFWKALPSQLYLEAFFHLPLHTHYLHLPSTFRKHTLHGAGFFHHTRPHPSTAFPSLLSMKVQQSIPILAATVNCTGAREHFRTKNIREQSSAQAPCQNGAPPRKLLWDILGPCKYLYIFPLHRWETPWVQSIVRHSNRSTLTTEILEFKLLPFHPNPTHEQPKHQNHKGRTWTEAIIQTSQLKSQVGFLGRGDLSTSQLFHWPSWIPPCTPRFWKSGISRAHKNSLVWWLSWIVPTKPYQTIYIYYLFYIRMECTDRLGRLPNARIEKSIYFGKGHFELSHLSQSRAWTHFSKKRMRTCYRQILFFDLSVPSLWNFHPALHHFISAAHCNIMVTSASIATVQPSLIQFQFLGGKSKTTHLRTAGRIFPLEIVTEARVKRCLTSTNMILYSLKIPHIKGQYAITKRIKGNYYSASTHYILVAGLARSSLKCRKAQVFKHSKDFGRHVVSIA